MSRGKQYFTPQRTLQPLSVDRPKRSQGVLRTLRWLLWSIAVVGGIGLFLLFTSCSTLDERDECCEEIRLIYRYIPGLEDEYPDHIREIHHYLFDGEGLYVRELRQTSPHSQQVVLRSLAVGKYTVLTLANRSDRFSNFPKLVEGETRLSDLSLTALYDTYREPKDGDPLYWNIREVVSERFAHTTYYCDLSNIHCHLLVRVVWGDIFPPGEGDYRLELDLLPETYDLHRPVRNGLYTWQGPGVDPALSGSSKERSYHEFPTNRGASGRIVAPVTLFGHELRHTFRSLRYTEEQIPTLRIYYNGQLYRKELDLTRFFRDQGLKPDHDPVQDYKIVVQINKDNILIFLRTGSRVVDWQDGGSISGGLSGS